MTKFLFNTGLSGVAAAALLALAPAHADVPTVNLVNDPNLIHVSGGCGPNGWRGQWGHCHYYAGHPRGFRTSHCAGADEQRNACRKHSLGNHRQERRASPNCIRAT